MFGEKDGMDCGAGITPISSISPRDDEVLRDDIAALICSPWLPKVL